MALSNTLFSHFFPEELRLQRNIDNYSLLRPSSNKSSSKGNSPKDAGKSQSSKDGDATFIDRTEFLITKVSIFLCLFALGFGLKLCRNPNSKSEYFLFV